MQLLGTNFLNLFEAVSADSLVGLGGRTLERRLKLFSENFIKGVVTKDTKWWPGKDFNSRWNERFGNHLAAAALANAVLPTDRLGAALIELIDAVVDLEDWSVESQPHDEVNSMHLSVGVAFGVASVFHFLDPQKLSRVVRRFVTLLEHSLENRNSNWYETTALIHNHSFHVLLHRYILSSFILDLHSRGSVELTAHEKTVAGDGLSRARDGFEKNLRLLDQIGDGSTFEGPHYASYSVQSLTTFLFLERLGRRKDNFSGKAWLSAYPRFMNATFVRSEAIAYSTGDAPFLWGYGPETSLFFVDWFLGGHEESRNLASEIVAFRESRAETHRVVRNMNAWLHHWIVAFKPGSATEYTPPKQVSEARFARNYRHPLVFDDLGLLAHSTARDNFFLRYGTYGGQTVSGFKSKNIGHSYPNIGDVTLVLGGKAVLTPPLYQKPKRSDRCNVPTVTTAGQEFGQDGTTRTTPSDGGAQNGNWIVGKSFYDSPLLELQREGQAVFAVVRIRNYSSVQLEILRQTVFTPRLGLFITDVVTNLNSESEAKQLSLTQNFTNTLHEFIPTWGAAISPQDGNRAFREIALIPKIANVLTNRPANRVSVTQVEEKVFEEPYSLSKLAIFTELSVFGQPSTVFFQKVNDLPLAFSFHVERNSAGITTFLREGDRHYHFSFEAKAPNQPSGIPGSKQT